MDTGGVPVLDRKLKPIALAGGERCRYLFNAREGTGIVERVEQLYIYVRPDDNAGVKSIEFELRYSFRRRAYVADTGVIGQAWVEII